MSTELAKEVLFFIENPYQATDKVVEIVEDGQRVIQIQRYESPNFGDHPYSAYTHLQPLNMLLVEWKFLI